MEELAQQPNATPDSGHLEESHAFAASADGGAEAAWDPQSEHEAIARLAHSYWEARGRQGGSPEEDWLRAEQEIRRRRAANS